MPSLASYACQPYETRGRLHPETECSTRSPHQRDRDRIIHCAAFRRLEYKTQVFVNHEGDHYRTRLTHSIEVSQIARSLCRVLHLNEDLGEALALAHDLGHTPFGHAGEDALDEVMQPYGGFDHNAQTLRILTSLEHRYAEFDGLNLTWETLEGIAKHNGPLLGEGLPPLPRAMQAYAQQHDLELHTQPSLEAQIAALSDDIAYNNHDMEDGLRAGLFTLADLADLPVVGEIYREVKQKYPQIDAQRLTHEVIRRMINTMANNLLAHTQDNLKAAGVTTCEAVRHHPHALANFSPDMRGYLKDIKAFLMEHMYRHYRVNRMTSKAQRVVRELFTFLVENPQCLPPQWFTQTDGAKSQATGIAVCDFIAGMTDRFALEEHARIFDINARG